MTIQRLTRADRVQAGLRRAEAKMMHVVESVNSPCCAVERYNLRQNDGSIRKITQLDNLTLVKTIKKIADKYITIGREIVLDNKKFLLNIK